MLDLRGITSYWVCHSDDDYKTLCAIAQDYGICPPKGVISTFEVTLSQEAIQTNCFTPEQLQDYPVPVIYALLDNAGHYDRTIHDVPDSSSLNDDVHVSYLIF